MNEQWIVIVGVVASALLLLLAFYVTPHVFKDIRRLHRLKKATGHIFKTQKPLRQLDNEELQAVKPFLTWPFCNSTSLLSNNVFALHGTYRNEARSVGYRVMSIRHYQVLGETYVTLPYDADKHLLGGEEINHCEVVLTKEFAVVIRINDKFDLKKAQTKRITENLSKQNNIQMTKEVRDQYLEVLNVEERIETAAEHQANSFDFGMIWAVVLALLSTVPLLNANKAISFDWIKTWVLTGTAMVTIAIVRMLYRRTNPKLRTVKKVAAAILKIDGLPAIGDGKNKTAYYIGDGTQVRIPAHWNYASLFKTSIMEIEERNHYVVKHGDVLSQDEEERNFPKIFYERYLVMAITGVVMWAFSSLEKSTILQNFHQLQALMSDYDFVFVGRAWASLGYLVLKACAILMTGFGFILWCIKGIAALKRSHLVKNYWGDRLRSQKPIKMTIQKKKRKHFSIS